MRVRYTPAAFADREAIFDYLNERSPLAAREVVGLIASRIAELADHPHKGHPSDRRVSTRCGSRHDLIGCSIG